ncbi:hypothetical protein BST61_g74 [Cercospora zeina]
MANANERRHYRTVENDQTLVWKLLAFFQRTERAMSNAARWIYHAPSQLIHAIANGFRAVWEFIKWLGVFTLKIILIFIALTLIVWAIPRLIRLVQIAYKARIDGRGTRDLEAAATRYRTRTQHQVPHRRHQDEHIFHSYQSEAVREAVSEERQRQDLGQAQGAEQERKRLEDERAGSKLTLRTPGTITGFDDVTLRHQLESTLGHQHPQSRMCLERITNAAEKVYADRALLLDENRLLLEQKNEKSMRASTRSTTVGRAKAVAYEDIVEAQRRRSEREVGEVVHSEPFTFSTSCADDE